MTEIHGKYADARVYADIIDSASEGQIKALCDMPHVVGSKICIMPDVHAGKGCNSWHHYDAERQGDPGACGR